MIGMQQDFQHALDDLGELAGIASGDGVMTAHLREEAFTPDWPDPAPRFLRDELPPPPALPAEKAG